MRLLQRFDAKDDVVEVVVWATVVALVASPRSGFFDDHRRSIVPRVHDTVAGVPNVPDLAFAFLRLNFQQHFSRRGIVPEDNRLLHSLVIQHEAAVSRKANAFLRTGSFSSR